MSPGAGDGGVLPVDKPSGPTSHDVVARARRALGIRKIGHTGTLDPFASGLLILCVGPATRLSEYLTGLDKSYVATVRLGTSTDTGDPEGAVTAEDAAWRGLGRADVEAGLAGLRGRILQVPPSYSAKKVEGERAYRRARRGESVELEPVEVEIHALDLLELHPPNVVIRLRCSSGTYVRAVGRDLGERLGTAAHLTALRRTRVGTFSVDEALPLDALADPGAVEDAWITPARAVAHLPSVEVDDEEAIRLAHGQVIRVPGGVDTGPREPVAVVRGGDLVAVAARDGDRLRPRKVFVHA